MRTIHFSLIALSLAAIVIAFSPNPNEITEARKQITAIGELIRIWDAEWLNAAAEKRLSEEKAALDKRGALRKELLTTFPLQPKGASGVVETNSEGKKIAYDVQFITPNWVIDGPIRSPITPDILKYGSLDNRSRDVLLDAPKTLEGFRNLWDILNKKHEIKVPTGLSDKMYVFSFGSRPPESAAIQWINTATTEIPKRPGLFLQLLPFRAPEETFVPSISADTAYVAYVHVGSSERVFLVTDEESLAFSPQEALISHFSRDKPVGGSFEHSFPELNKVTKNYQSLEVSKFDPILEAEQSRTGESFEAFGVKFPAEATTRWGILVILAVQMYFWIHLHELMRKLKPNDEGWEVAFVGMYPSLPSRVIYFASALVLPVCAVAALGVRGLFVGSFHWAYWSLLIAGTIFSLSLAFAAWHSGPRRDVQLAVGSPGQNRAEVPIAPDSRP